MASISMFDRTNYEPFMNEDKGLTGIVEAACILFFSFIGFDFLTTLSLEAINPTKNIPIAIETSVILSAFIFSVMAFALNGVGNIAKLSSGGGETAIAEIF